MAFGMGRTARQHKDPGWGAEADNGLEGLHRTGKSAVDRSQLRSSGTPAPTHPCLPVGRPQVAEACPTGPRPFIIANMTDVEVSQANVQALDSGAILRWVSAGRGTVLDGGKLRPPKRLILEAVWDTDPPTWFTVCEWHESWVARLRQ